MDVYIYKVVGLLFDNFYILGVVVGIVEVYGNVDYKFFIVGGVDILDLCYLFDRFFYSGVGILKLKGF